MRQKLVTLFLLAFALSSVAQEMAEVETDTATIKNLNLDEITVRSPKYNSNVFSLPAAVTMVTARTIENYQMRSLNDVTGVVPNFFMPEYGSKLTSPVYIRGIGNRINTPSVGLYVDNIPYFEKSVFNFDFFDLERIEVLRGPQGTLYGRNTMGGLINVFTSEPWKDRETSLMVSYGNFNQLNTSIMHNQPLGKKLSMIANINQLHNDGFFTNTHLDKVVDKMDSYSGRLKFLYTPTSQWKLLWNIQFESSEQGGYPYAKYDVATQSAGDISYDHESTYERDMVSSGLNIEYRGNGYKFRAMSSVQWMKDGQDIDQDFTNKAFYAVTQDQNQTMMAQEVSIQSEEGRRYEWIFGAFGFAQLLDKQVDANYLPASRTSAKSYDNSTSGAALYHQSTLRFNNLSIIGGIRLDYEKATFDYLYNQITPTAVKGMDTIQSDLVFKEFLPKLAIEYRISDGLTPYVSVAKGYNSGGFNSTIERDEDATFDPEISWNYEAGIRAKWLNRRIYSNLTFFYIDWTNQQIYQPVPSGQGSMLTNAGKSKSQGVEFEAKAIPLDNLETWITFGYNDAEFVEYVNKVDYSANKIPYVPEYTYSVGANYSIRINTKWLETVRMNAVYQGLGKHYWHEDNVAFQKPYELLSGRISLVRKNIELTAWGKNLLDTKYNSFYFTALGNTFAQVGKPLTMGMSLKFAF